MDNSVLTEAVLAVAVCVALTGAVGAFCAMAIASLFEKHKSCKPEEKNDE